MNTDFTIAVHCLLILDGSKTELLKSGDISKVTSIHPTRVRKILSILKNNGFIDSKEGVNGGFSLVSDIDKIHLDKLYRITKQETMKTKCHPCKNTCCYGEKLEKTIEGVFNMADLKLQDFLKEYTVKNIQELINNKDNV